MRVKNAPHSIAFLAVAAFLGCTPAIAQQRVPRFEAGPCAFEPGDWAKNIRLECGALVVALDRQHPERKTLRLAVAVLHPRTPASEPPLVLLHGGPGGPGGLRAETMPLAIRWSSALHRDIVVYDVRGAGYSEPELCPDVAAQPLGLRADTSDAERERRLNEAGRQCVANLKRDGIDPHFFNTRVNAEDLIDLRKVLGYESWDVFGVSYGARLAQEAMRRDPKAAHSAILASPWIPGVAKAEDPLSVARIVEQIFAACGAQLACRSDFPSPKQDLDELYAELNAKPMEVVVQRGGSQATVVLDGHGLISRLAGRFTAAQINRLPLLLHELRRGDRAAAARLLVGDGLGPTVGNALQSLVLCYDLWGADYRRAVENVRSQLKEPYRALHLNEGVACGSYLERFADPEEHEFVRSDIPTLILTNEFDDRTPTEHGRRIAASLSHAYLFELPGLGHAETPAGCFDTIVESFLKNAARPPDAGCVATMPQLTFETSRLERPMLFFTINVPDGARTPFAGAWDAAYPNAPRPFNFALSIARGAVTGSVTAGGGALTLPILEGTADERTITFKVNSPDGGRTITFTGTLDGDRILFVRDVVVLPGGDPGGAALWGVSGARTVTARRIAANPLPPR